MRRWRRPWRGAVDRSPLASCGYRRKTSESSKSSDSKPAAPVRMPCSRFANAARIPNGWRVSWRVPRAASPSKWASPGSRIAMPSPPRLSRFRAASARRKNSSGLRAKDTKSPRRRLTRESCRAARSRATASISRCAMCIATRCSCASASRAWPAAGFPTISARSVLAVMAAICSRCCKRRNDRKQARAGAAARIGASCSRRRAA